MGIALEFLQGMTDTRSFEVLDMVANAVGVALGWITVFVLEKFKHD
jgi:glycopeptide antibiotics resistance protein